MERIAHVYIIINKQEPHILNALQALRPAITLSVFNFTTSYEVRKLRMQANSREQERECTSLYTGTT
jgi:hypothetical protein